MDLIAQYDTLLLDLDGVVYRGSGAVPHAVEALAAAEADGVGLGFVTNNASRPPQVVADHLSSLGLPASAEQVVTSAQVGAQLLGRQVAAGSPVLAVGGPGVAESLVEQGFRPIRVAQERRAGRSDIDIATSVAGVLQGFGTEVDWRDLAVASYAVARGAVWVATNTDRTIPRAEGIVPGNGPLVAAVTEATGVVPPSAGKPAPEMMTIAAQRLGANRPLVIGDRLDTDIRGASAAGFDSLLVLTGVTDVVGVLMAPAIDRPTYLAVDMQCLRRPGFRLDDPASNDPATRLIRDVWGEQEIGFDLAARQIRGLLGA